MATGAVTTAAVLHPRFGTAGISRRVAAMPLMPLSAVGRARGRGLASQTGDPGSNLADATLLRQRCRLLSEVGRAPASHTAGDPSSNPTGVTFP